MIQITRTLNLTFNIYLNRTRKSSADRLFSFDGKIVVKSKFAEYPMVGCHSHIPFFSQPEATPMSHDL